MFRIVIIAILRRNGGNDMAKPRNLCKEDKRELSVLAKDFGLLYLKEVQEIIQTCKSYSEGHRRIMGIYNQVYM